MFSHSKASDANIDIIANFVYYGKTRLTVLLIALRFTVLSTRNHYFQCHTRIRFYSSYERKKQTVVRKENCAALVFVYNFEIQLQQALRNNIDFHNCDKMDISIIIVLLNIKAS